jgi:hypothetical protein
VLHPNPGYKETHTWSVTIVALLSKRAPEIITTWVQARVPALNDLGGPARVTQKPWTMRGHWDAIARSIKCRSRRYRLAKLCELTRQ